MKWLTDLLTTADGVTHDIGRWSWLGSLISINALAIHEVWSGKPIDFVAFGTGVAAIVTAHGAAIWAKKDTEPK